MSEFALFCMIFMHILSDFCLQGILASMKQKSWWKENYPKDIYKYDWVAALLIHSFFWAFCIMLPIYVAYGYVWNYKMTTFLIVNTLTHMYIDNEKANSHSMNLIIDQVFHMIQIVWTWFVFYSDFIHA